MQLATLQREHRRSLEELSSLQAKNRATEILEEKARVCVFPPFRHLVDALGCTGNVDTAFMVVSACPLIFRA